MALNVDSVKAAFFNTKAVTEKLDPAVRKAMSKFGAFVRQRSKSSIKRKPYGQRARPGQPPFAHGKSLIKKILFSYDAKKDSVVIGPVLAGPKDGAPETLEHGKHPFMRPAFNAELSNVGNDFKNLIR